MTYRLRYHVWVIQTLPGAAPNTQLAGSKGTTLEFFESASAAVGTATFTGPDVTTLTNAMASDIAAQLNVPATLSRISNWSANTFPATQ